MHLLEKRVAAARRRMTIQTALSALPWTCAIALLVAAAVILVGKYSRFELSTAAVIGTAGGAGLVLAAIWGTLRRPTTMSAAIELDRRFALGERVSSALALDAATRETPAGRAVLADALAHVEGVRTGDRFGLAFNRRPWLPLVPAALALAIALVLDPVVDENPAAATPSQQAEQEQVKNSTTKLRRSIVEQKERARTEGLKEAEELFSKFEKATKDLEKKPQDRRQAMVELNRLADELKKRREDLAGNDKLRDQLKSFKQLGEGPANKLAAALRAGDFQQAAEQVRQLQQQLEKGNLDPEAKAALAKQLGELAEKLEGMAQGHREAQNELQKQIAQQRAAGNEKSARELEEKLAELARSAPAADKLAEMAQQLSECQSCFSGDNAAGAGEAMEQLLSELEQLGSAQNESELLEGALADLRAAKDSMVCAACNGEGCQACNGGAGGRNQQGGGVGGLEPGNQPGGQGEAGDPIDAKPYDSQVRQRVGRGAAAVSGLADGPNSRGRVEQQIDDQVESVRRSETDPLSGQRLPRGYREHAKTYFDALREGKQSPE